MKNMTSEKFRLGINQPYLFPYLGYFQLIHAVDQFLLLDDVTYIKQGWINRNKILLNGTEHLFTLPLCKASPNRNINEIDVLENAIQRKKLLRTFEMAYSKAPQFHQVFPILEEIIGNTENNLSLYILFSLQRLGEYLGIETPLNRTSAIEKDDTLTKSERLIDICKRLKATDYINPIGGTALYSKDYFNTQGIDLHFIKSRQMPYSQFKNQFIPYLSVIDVIMFNNRDVSHQKLEEYDLI